MFGHPARDPLPHLQFEAIDRFGMRILGGAQHEFIILKDVNEAGVAFQHGCRKIHKLCKNLREGCRSGIFGRAFQSKVRRLLRDDLRQKLNVTLIFLEFAGGPLQGCGAFGDKNLELTARLFQFFFVFFFSRRSPSWQLVSKSRRLQNS